MKLTPASCRAVYEMLIQVQDKLKALDNVTMVAIDHSTTINPLYTGKLALNDSSLKQKETTYGISKISKEEADQSRVAQKNT